MAEMTDRDCSGDQVKLEVPLLSTLQYQISYGEDHTLQWSPAVGSKELAIALSYHFPMQKDLESKMQAAMKVFLHQEQQSLARETEQVKSSCVEQSTMRQQLSTPPAEPPMTSGLDIRPTVAPTLQILTWDSKMKDFYPKTKRRRYEKDERTKVTANRGFACQRHRRQKMKVGVS
jgi:exonuclease VII large subunit